MIFNADSFTFKNNKYQKPIITLYKPDRSELTSLGLCKNLNLTLRFNTFSEMSFTIRKTYKRQGDSKDFKYYSSLKKNNLVHVVGFGWWVIDKVTEKHTGNIPKKEVHCFSYEHTLNSRNINLLNDTYKFYDIISPQNTLLGKILSVLPSWSVGHVDSDLWKKYRTFDVPNSSVYSFLMNDVEKAYECIFDFDTENKTINAYTTQNIIKQTGISLSFKNLIKEIQIEETDDNLINAMGVYGSGDMDIRYVNPIGGNVMYNFDYFTQPDEDGVVSMPEHLVNAIAKWQNKITAQEGIYGTLLATLKTKKGELLTLEGQLNTLTSELSALEGVRTARLDSGISPSDVTRQIDVKNIEIVNKNNEITSKQVEIDSVNSQLITINSELKFESNFTQEQLLLLDNYISEGSFSNSNFIKTSKMTPIDIQEMSQQLYQQGKEELRRRSQPIYTFSMNTANFLFIEKFSKFISQIQLGCTVDAEVRDGYWVRPLLLEFTIDYDNPTNFNMTFGNKFRISEGMWNISDLLRESSLSNNTVQSQLPVINGKQNVVDEASVYMKNALDTSLQEIINTNGQHMTWGDYGLWGKKILDTGLIDPRQIRISNNQIVMTKDGWNSLVLAIGNINGYYGINAEILLGKLIAGNELIITNENNSFTVNGEGVTLYNAILTLLRKDKMAQFIMNPDDGFKIQTKSGNLWRDSFYVDFNGKIIANDINVERGSIGGWQIQNNGLISPWGDYIKSDGTGRLGLLTYTPYSATFDGYIYASNLLDQVQEDKLADSAVGTDKIKSGAVTPSKLDRVYADYGEFSTLISTVAHINEAYIDYATCKTLVADEISTKNLVTVNGTFSGDINWGVGGSIVWSGATQTTFSHSDLAFVGYSIFFAQDGYIEFSTPLTTFNSEVQINSGAGGLRLGGSWTHWRTVTIGGASFRVLADRPS